MKKLKLKKIIQEILLEKKKADRCLRIARRKIPKSSAYRSGNIERCRKGDIWKSLKEEEIYGRVVEILLEKSKRKGKESLYKWFNRNRGQGWVDCNTCRKNKDGEVKCKACGRKKGEKRAKYPSCRSTPKKCKDPGKGTKWGKTK